MFSLTFATRIAATQPIWFDRGFFSAASGWCRSTACSRPPQTFCPLIDRVFAFCQTCLARLQALMVFLNSAEVLLACFLGRALKEPITSLRQSTSVYILQPAVVLWCLGVRPHRGWALAEARCQRQSSGRGAPNGIVVWIHPCLEIQCEYYKTQLHMICQNINAMFVCLVLWFLNMLWTRNCSFRGLHAGCTWVNGALESQFLQRHSCVDLRCLQHLPD